MRTDTEKVIKEYGVRTLFNENNIRRAEEQLGSDEIVLYIAPTNAVIYTGLSKKKVSGVVVITNKRVFLYSKILFSVTIESFNMKDLNSIDSSSNGLTGSTIKLHTNTKSMEILVSYKASIAEKIIKLLDTTMNEAKNNNGNKNTSVDSIEQIRKLSELKDQGILTQEEFEKKKQDLLGKI